MNSDNPPPPPPLGYRPAGARNPQPAREPALKGFLLGLFAGAGASCFMWIAGWDDFGGERAFPGTVAVVLVIKLVCAVIFIKSRRFPGVGGGLLTSIPIGGLIFFGSCSSHFTLR